MAPQPMAEESTAAASAAAGEVEPQAQVAEVPLPHQAATHAPPTPGSGSASHKDKKARVKDDEEVFHVDLKSATPDMDRQSLNHLAEGWTYDEKTNEFVLSPTRDFWSFEDGFLVRNHCWSRDHTFVLNDSQLPFGLAKADLQKTKGLTMINGHRKIYVNDEESYVVGNGQWHGKTLFPLTKEATTQRRMAYAGDLEAKTKNRWTLRGRGHVWAAVSVPKKRKEKDDLREGKMRLEDRLAFVEGKKAELSSIFENGVWEVERHPEQVDHGRVMRARFVLKWVTDQKGNPRAKARLVLQGFSDPDLLQGSLETSSPTLSRISRQVLLAVAVNEGWSKFTADVSTAFLQGDRQERMLWCKIPADACRLIGCAPGTYMKLLKPLYGQADAPRAWFRVAQRRLCQCGYEIHCLDHCLYKLHNRDGRLVSLIGLHVDDLIGAGDESDEDYQKAREALKKEFNFKHWTSDVAGELEFCGNRLTRCEDESWKLQQEDYLKKIKPMTTVKKAADEELRPSEVSALRGLLGALQWASTQSSPHLSASISLLCGNVNGATQSVAEGANKTLRFAKANADASLRFQRLGPLSDLCMIAISDAAWGIRQDHLSQGGFFILLAHRKMLEGEMDQPYMILEWRSYKLSRVSRSSLNAEAQACSAAVDSLEFLHIFWQACHQSGFQLSTAKSDKRGDKHFLPTALVIDAKALYDAIKSEVPQISGDKRTQIEVMIVKEKMKSMSTQLRWVSSEVQLSDGLTKTQARQLLADRLRSHRFSMVADSSFQAAKKKSVEERKESARRNAISAKKSLTMMIVSSSVQPVVASTDKDTDTDWMLIAITLLVGIGLVQLINWLQGCWQQRHNRGRRQGVGEERAMQTEAEPPQVQRQERTEQLEAKIEQYKEYIRRGNMVNQDLRKTITDLREEIEQRQWRQEKTDHELDRHQQMIEEISEELREVRIQAAAARGSLAGIPRTVFLSKRGERYHLTTDCNGLNNSNGVQGFDYCSFCANRVMYPPEEGHRPSMIPIQHRASSSS